MIKILNEGRTPNLPKSDERYSIKRAMNITLAVYLKNELSHEKKVFTEKFLAYVKTRGKKKKNDIIWLSYHFISFFLNRAPRLCNKVALLLFFALALPVSTIRGRVSCAQVKKKKNCQP